MTKPKYFKFSSPNGDLASVARCVQGTVAICVMMHNDMILDGN